ncbi:uncharacterized protein F5Z01DRAFT_427501 [Emericellopsis atlantica]|uniref:Rhodopsin domain-containing protein n=1 Tax=Emericellopsis atlantica TaxID=2614577 RepID=A0A9P7ZE75_9HYPO|nr:uncharacterized protein F5Z01DRAFT_427501 [Emericellopsis atlantica]KAG9250101.1 hypothetical protein F5Z01DRAFT_427501 [Emericellopsis atlantica]
MSGKTMSTEGLDPKDNNVHLVYIPAAVFVVICPVLVALRVWARLRGGGSMGPDDYAAIAALVFVLLLSGFLVAACQYGMGRHMAFLEPDVKYETMKFFYLAQVVYKAAINLSKVCILLLYLRIFNKIRWFRFACWALLGCVGSYMIASVFATIFQCSPIQRSFDKSIKGTCVDNSQFWYANAGFSIATDVIILLLPMPLVYQLQVPWPQKVALMAVFALGIFVVVTSCLRVTTLDILATTPDTTYDIANVMWTIIEPNIAVVCACLPILRPFIVKLIPMLRSKGYSNPYATPGYGTGTHKSRGLGTQVGGSQARGGGGDDDAHWVEIGGGKNEGMVMTTMQRNNSVAGSQDSILGGKTATNTIHHGAGDRNSDGHEGIQKTVEYTVQYSNKD